jgi:hypothetical protein
LICCPNVAADLTNLAIVNDPVVARFRTPHKDGYAIPPPLLPYKGVG